MAAAPGFVAAEPCLFVTDFDRARDFYVGKLGFFLETEYGEPPFYGLVTRGAARLALRHVDEPVFKDGVREKEQLLSASLTLASGPDIVVLHAAWSSAGAEIVKPLTTEPWGARTFILRDPDGNLLLVAAPGG
jgi:catechol 2,3-dioxygenase-like lactoylglutathione lyase family enzyme